MNQSLLLKFSILNKILATFISIGAIYYIFKDFRNNRYIAKSSSSMLFLIFFAYCILASIINGNGFQNFNNIYFVIHSSLFFFFVIAINHDKKILNYTIMIILVAVFIISATTLIMFLCNKFNITQNFSSENLQKVFFESADVSGRWSSILSNSNTYAHLVSMTFFLSFIPFYETKKKRYKFYIFFMSSINLLVLLFSGSKGALLAMVLGVVLGVFEFIIYGVKNKKKKHIKKITLFLLSLILISLIIIKIIPVDIIDRSLDFFKIDIFRIDTIATGTGRVGIWKALLNLPIISHPFGYNDNYIYLYLKNLDIKYYSAFLNNAGRAHNMFLQVLVSYGFIGFLLFFLCLIKTLIQVIKFAKSNKYENKLSFSLFLLQFIVILIGGSFEQLPIFNMSAHSLIFMLVWANLLAITEKYD